jgi:hypothetical protein
MFAAELGSLESVRLLPDAGANPNAATTFAATRSCGASATPPSSGCSCRKALSADARSKPGRTPLLIAPAYDGATEASRLLVEKGRMSTLVIREG